MWLVDDDGVVSVPVRIAAGTLALFAKSPPPPEALGFLAMYRAGLWCPIVYSAIAIYTYYFFMASMSPLSPKLSSGQASGP